MTLFLFSSKVWFMYFNLISFYCVVYNSLSIYLTIYLSTSPFLSVFPLLSLCSFSLLYPNHCYFSGHPFLRHNTLSCPAPPSRPPLAPPIQLQRGKDLGEVGRPSSEVPPTGRKLARPLRIKSLQSFFPLDNTGLMIDQVGVSGGSVERGERATAGGIRKGGAGGRGGL